MKIEARRKARLLRSQGKSLSDIALTVGASKSTVSIWCRNIQLTRCQKNALSSRAQQRGTEAVRRSRMRRWHAFYQAAETEWIGLKDNRSFVLGLGIYMGEGDKADGVVGVSNCDPEIIRATLRFLDIIQCPPDKRRLKVQVHDACQIQSALCFWQRETGLGPNYFTQCVVNTPCSSMKKRGRLQPYGTCHVRVFSTELRQKIKRWIQLALVPECEVVELPAFQAGD